MSVIVSVDGATGTRAAIQLAAREAAYRGCPLVAVASYAGYSPLGGPAARPSATLSTADEGQAATGQMLADAVQDALGDDAGAVQRQLIRGLAGRRFVAAMRDARAELVVLTARGSMSLLLGAVSQYVLRHAPCPVLVVPEGTGAA
jgi:nucleotide-binding universal stress UspA family protein